MDKNMYTGIWYPLDQIILNVTLPQLHSVEDWPLPSEYLVAQL